MANKYVSPSGNNSNNGDGPDASHASNKPYLTIDYAIDAMADGDILYVGPGIYRENVNPADTISSERIIRGDPLNTQGFKDGSGVLLAQGPCIITNMLTDDVTNSTNTTTFTTNGKSNITLENLWIESLSAAYALTIAAASTNIKVTGCYIYSLTGAVSITGTANTTHSHAFSRCIIQGWVGTGVAIVLPKHSAEYDADIEINNCQITAVTNTAVAITTSGTNTNFGTGVNCQNCLLSAGTYGFDVGTNYNAALTLKMNVSDCIISGYYGLRGGNPTNDSDVVTASYNFIVANVPRTKVSVGTGDMAYGSSVFARSIRHDFGQSQLFGFYPKSFMAPWSTSRTIGYGNDSTPTALTTDIWNRVRPSGSGVAAASILNSIGAHELHDYGTLDTGTKDAGDSSLKLVGPGDHEFKIPVAAESTTISIKVRYDSATYGGTNYPQAILLDLEAFANISGNTETETATVAASDAWETLTFTAFTPSRKGTIRLRLVNRGSGADDICWFDTLGVA